ncbi:MAG: hypothetical protein MJ120_00045 [Clostridia bacterium]|nr:hypothetical protein [Clostridia bacterium]
MANERIGIVIPRTDEGNGLSSARERYEKAVNASREQIDIDPLVDFLIKKALEHFAQQEGT